MKHMSRISLLTLIIIIITSASCTKTVDVLTVSNGFVIEDYVYFHNMGITFDGDYYYTINGGNEEFSLINIYDKKGKLIKTEEPSLDARSIHYIEDINKYYVKIYGLDIVDLDRRDFSSDIDYLYYMWGDNSSVAFGPAGEYLYELYNGEVIVVETEEGLEVNNFFLDRYYDEHLYNSSIAVGEKYLYIWGSPNKILIYDFAGELIDSLILKINGYAPSLSYCNNMLWIAEDADAAGNGGYGYWYGFKVE